MIKCEIWRKFLLIEGSEYKKLREKVRRSPLFDLFEDENPDDPIVLVVLSEKLDTELTEKIKKNYIDEESIIFSFLEKKLKKILGQNFDLEFWEDNVPGRYNN